mmetsp:Transcript_35224/g.79480  ORF Transcript_35224/g.79480 Transcript_35224/m.79480 type:complete len:298 (+) Transcript_35224:151-1044(+)
MTRTDGATPRAPGPPPLARAGPPQGGLPRQPRKVEARRFKRGETAAAVAAAAGPTLEEGPDKRRKRLGRRRTRRGRGRPLFLLTLLLAPPAPPLLLLDGFRRQRQRSGRRHSSSNSGGGRGGNCPSRRPVDFKGRLTTWAERRLLRPRALRVAPAIRAPALRAGSAAHRRRRLARADSRARPTTTAKGPSARQGIGCGRTGRGRAQPTRATTKPTTMQPTTMQPTTTMATWLRFSRRWKGTTTATTRGPGLLLGAATAAATVCSQAATGRFPSRRLWGPLGPRQRPRRLGCTAPCWP